MYIVGRMPDSELVIKTINTFGESFSVLCGFRTASKKEILKSYRKLAVKWHPDQYKGDDKKKAEKMFIDIAAAKEVLTDPGKQNSLVCISVLPFVRSNGSSIIHSVGSVVCMVGRSVGRSVVCPYGRSVPSFLRSVCSLFVWSVDRNLRFGQSFGCYLVCSFSQQKVLWLYSFVCSFGSVFSFSFLRTVVDPSLFVFDRPCSRSSGG